MNSTVQQTVPKDALDILQEARREHDFASDGYRILDAAICHLLGIRGSSVDYVAEVK